MNFGRLISYVWWDVLFAIISEELMKDLVLQNCRLDGRYDVRDRLGRGSYAEVFLAQDALASPQSPHRQVVIKALNVFLQNDLDPDLERTLVENFQNEALALDRVRHPNILSRLGHGTAKDLRGTVFHYLVLEYLSGGDLAKHCRDHRLSLTQALSYIEQVCAGLSKAHSNGIIHRDIKPQNLLLTTDRKIVKIADFGVARVVNSDSPITRVGTNIYAPPEHSPLLAGATGDLENGTLTPASDVYSLAKTAYVLFTGESPRYLANRPVTELPQGFRHKSWAPRLIEILQRATDEDPAKRHQDVFEFWKDLSAAISVSDDIQTGIATHVSTRHSTLPQAQIALGFTQRVPAKPDFDTSRELKLKDVKPTAPLKRIAIGEPGHGHSFQKPALSSLPSKQPPVLPNPLPSAPVQIPAIEVPKRKPRRFLKVFLIFSVLLVVFAGSLFATYNFLLGNPLFSGITSPARVLGTATTDINLRPGPTTSNSPVGIVTKDSRVQIVQTSNNWHEVVIIQHGRPKSNPAFADRGWVYGSYIAEDK